MTPERCHSIFSHKQPSPKLLCQSGRTLFDEKNCICKIVSRVCAKNTYKKPLHDEPKKTHFFYQKKYPNSKKIPFCTKNPIRTRKNPRIFTKKKPHMTTNFTKKHPILCQKKPLILPKKNSTQTLTQKPSIVTNPSKTLPKPLIFFYKNPNPPIGGVTAQCAHTAGIARGNGGFLLLLLIFLSSYTTLEHHDVAQSDVSPQPPLPKPPKAPDCILNSTIQHNEKHMHHEHI